MLFIASLSLPFVVAHNVLNCIWLRLIMVPQPPSKFYEAIDIILSLAAAFTVVITADAIGLFGNRAILH